jgi:hypothetical protein
MHAGIPVEKVVSIAEEAGKAILGVYHSEVGNLDHIAAAAPTVGLF